MLYVASQYDRDLDRAREVGQLTKVDPSVPGVRIVWKVDDQGGFGGGLYGTPAVVGDMVYAGTNGRSEEHTSELQSLMRISYPLSCLEQNRKARHTPAKTRYKTEDTHV